MKKRAIICDIDGTIANIDHRQHLVQGHRKDWKAFFARVDKDTPNEWCVNIIQMYIAAGFEIIFMSGRHEELRKVTEKWLDDHVKVSYKLFMRMSKDYRQDCIIKEELYNDFVKDDFNIEIVIDDRQQVVDMWRKLGLTCLQCAKGDF